MTVSSRSSVHHSEAGKLSFLVTVSSGSSVHHSEAGEQREIVHSLSIKTNTIVISRSL